MKYVLVIISLLIIFGVSLYFSMKNHEAYQNMKVNYSNVISAENKNYLSQNANTPGVATYSQTLADISNKNQFTDNSALRYSADNLNIEYHDPAADIENNGIENTKFSKITMVDSCGNRIYLPNSGTQGYSTFNNPGEFPYGPSTYVPNYEDSVYLSRSTGQNTNAKVYDTTSMNAGFCTQNKNSPNQLEESCNHLDKNVCASTNCCVLLGGAKCVSGNQQGVINKSNYNDPLLLNKDFYYYQGKCYGNCFGA